jgi:hypothetical protein
MKKPFILYYESANYCGYGHHAIVLASDETEAEELSEGAMEDYFREQDEDQYFDEYGEDNPLWASLISCEELTKDHESWKFACTEDQAQFYEFIGITQDELRNL